MMFDKFEALMTISLTVFILSFSYVIVVSCNERISISRESRAHNVSEVRFR